VKCTVRGLEFGGFIFLILLQNIINKGMSNYRRIPAWIIREPRTIATQSASRLTQARLLLGLSFEECALGAVYFRPTKVQTPI
jgi:hypothetical protein